MPTTIDNLPVWFIEQWNVVFNSLQFPPGMTGAPGPAGPDGATGPAGDAGPAGPAGGVGPAGATGPAGTAGATGANGPAGAPGSTGTAGATGAAGVKGGTALTLSAGGTTLALLGATLLELGAGKTRAQVDLTGYTKARLSLAVTTAGQGSVRVERSPDQVTWTALDGASGPSCSLATATGVTSGWATINGASLGDLWLRLATVGGNGLLSPAIGNAVIELAA